MSEAAEHEKKILERVTLFNDAVYGIVLTLLVIELHVPELTDHDSGKELIEKLEHLWPHFFAFFLSALMVGGQWISSIHIQRTIAKTTNTYMAFMVIYLIIVALLPFCCSMIGEYPDNPVSYVVFGALSVAYSCCGYLYMSYCLRKNLFHPDADLEELKKLMKAIPFVIVLMVAMSAIAFYSTLLSMVLFLVWSTLPFILTPKLRVNHKS